MLFFWSLLGVGCAVKSFIFHPEKAIRQTPADVGLPFEEINLETSDRVSIHGWFIPYSGARTTLLWLHGNGGNIGHRVGRIERLRPALQSHILIIDYRGYGQSGGQVSEEGTYLDAIAAYDYLLTRSDIDGQRIVPFGVSLGTAVAVELALRRKVGGVILEAPFTSIREMARKTVPWLPIGPFITTRYDNLSKIGRINAPLLILHGDRDEVIPYAQGQRLFEGATQPKIFYTISDAGHNDTDQVGGQAYFDEMARFIDRLP